MKGKEKENKDMCCCHERRMKEKRQLLKMEKNKERCMVLWRGEKRRKVRMKGKVKANKDMYCCQEGKVNEKKE